jgi:hypothetical protein
VRDGPQGPGDPGVTRPKYPPGLGDGGRRLWAEVKAARKELGPGEAVLLEEACRMKDRLDRLAIQLTGNPFGGPADGYRAAWVHDLARAGKGRRGQGDGTRYGHCGDDPDSTRRATCAQDGGAG